MNVSKAIFSANNTFYLEYWPKQAEMCKAVLGVEPVLFWITDEDSDFYDDGNGLVKKIKRVDWVDDAIQACIVRFWAPLLFPEETCILCDIDMFMFNRDYFIEQVKDIHEDDLVIYTSDSYDRSRPEMQGFFQQYNLPFEQDMYSVCYSAAKGKVFSKIMSLEGSFEDFLRMVSERPGYHMSWYVDEFFYSDCVNNTDHGVKVHYLKRRVTTPFWVPMRIEKYGIPSVHYDLHQFMIDRDKYGPYDEGLLKSGHYIDFHAPRPYSRYKEFIDKTCDIVKDSLSKVKESKENLHFTKLAEEDLNFLKETRNLVSNDFLHDSRKFTYEETLNWFRSFNPDYRIIWAGEERIGYFRISNYSSNNKNLYIGADIHPIFQGKGYAKEAYKKIIPQLFDEYDLHKISLEVLATNHRAIALYRKLGFTHEGSKREEVLKDGRYIDSIIMSILRDEWK